MSAKPSAKLLRESFHNSFRNASPTSLGQKQRALTAPTLESRRSRKRTWRHERHETTLQSWSDMRNMRWHFSGRQGRPVLDSYLKLFLDSYCLRTTSFFRQEHNVLDINWLSTLSKKNTSRILSKIKGPKKKQVSGLSKIYLKSIISKISKIILSKIYLKPF